MSYLRKRLAKKLENAFEGCKVNPDELFPAKGAYRTNKQLDNFVWEGIIVDEHGIRRCIGSYQTMTELVKCDNFVYTDNEIMGWTDEVREL